MEEIKMNNLLIKVLAKVAPKILENWDYYKSIIICNTKYRNENIRISISYLYKIKLKNKYLLVKSNRIPNQFQPVGGVYKVEGTGHKKIFSDLDVLTDAGYRYDDGLEGDLRIKVKGKNVHKFINWFKQDIDRENNPIREFREELLDTGILYPRTDFEDIKYRFKKRVICPLKWSDKFECQEILIRDIFEYEPSEKQLVALNNIFDKETDKYMWFEAEEIQRRGRMRDLREYNVGEHTCDTL